MNKIYKQIWSHDKALSLKDLEKVDGHDLCYLALFYASRYEVQEARNTLNQIRESQPGHSCSIIAETNALVYFFLREFNSASDYASNALREEPKVIFANWVLAQIARGKRKYSDTIKYYKNILEIDPDSQTIRLNIVEAYVLNRNRKEAREYLEMAKPSPRKTLYNLFLITFGYMMVRLLWLIIMFSLIALSPYLFISVYLLMSVVLIYILIKWGVREGDLVLFWSSLYIQTVNSGFFMITICGLLDKLFKFS